MTKDEKIVTMATYLNSICGHPMTNTAPSPVFVAQATSMIEHPEYLEEMLYKINFKDE